jgi:ribonuclease BN (tRNA processing enzyme)
MNLMKIRVLGCAGSISKESKTSAFLINDRVLIDGGTICSSLSLEEIKQLKNIFISHAHFDHVKGLPTLVENLIFMQETVPVTIHGSAHTLNSIGQHLMNGIIWPDFSVLPNEQSPILKYNCLDEGVVVPLDGLSVTPYFLFQNFSDFGYFIEDGKSTLLYTSDIGTDSNLTIKGKVPDSMIIEVSVPNEKEELALQTGHLTPLLMIAMINKLPVRPRNVFVAHLKAFFRDQIIDEIRALGMPNLVILNDGDILDI